MKGRKERETRIGGQGEAEGNEMREGREGKKKPILLTLIFHLKNS